jgi:truncated hemoglobin YjbI
MTLFEKYGGVDFWIDLINEFYSEVIKSPILSHHFETKDMESIKNMILGIIQSTFTVQGESELDFVRQSHKHLSISNQDFNEWITLYTQVLERNKVSKSDQLRLLEVMENFRLYLVTNRS